MGGLDDFILKSIVKRFYLDLMVKTRHFKNDIAQGKNITIEDLESLETFISDFWKEAKDS